MNMPVGVACRTCLSSNGQLNALDQKVPYLEQATYHDLLEYCTRSQPMESERKPAHTYMAYICLRCTKALQVSYHFLTMVRRNDSTLQEQEDCHTELKIKVEQDLRSSTKLEIDQDCYINDEATFANGIIHNNVNVMNENSTLNTNSNCETQTDDSQVSKIEMYEFDDSLEADFKDFILMENELNQTDDSLEPFNVDIVAIDTAETYNDNIPNEPKNNLPKTKESNVITNIERNKENNFYTGINTFISEIKEQFDNGKREVTSNISYMNRVNVLKEGTDSLSAGSEELVAKTVSTFNCLQCNQSFTENNAFIRHQNRHRGITPFRCQYCNFFTCYSESMRKHYKKDHNIEAINELLNAPIDPKIAPVEKKFTEVTFICRKCDQEYHKRNDIITHLANQHLVTKNADTCMLLKFNCPECPRRFKDLRGMRVHFGCAHGKGRSAILPTGPFECDTCKKEFTFKASLRAHERCCRGAQELVHCNLCAKDLSTVRLFEEHLFRDHAIEMIHECEVCGRTFKNQHALTLHRKRHAERFFQCDLCPKNYINRSELNVHIERIHSKDTKALCRICGACFTNAGSLRTHEAKEHIKKLHKCNYCSYKNSSLPSLKLHQYLHTGMPYRCEICSKGFAFRKFMRRHSLIEHKIDLTDDDLGNMFRKNIGYPSRYDAFSHAKHTLEMPEVNEEDIEKELSEFGLKFDDIFRELLDVRNVCNESMDIN